MPSLSGGDTVPEVTPAQVAEWEALAAKATPEPWMPGKAEDDERGYVRRVIGANGRVILWLESGIDGTVETSEADVDFICDARTAVPALCAALREAWQEIEQYRKVLADNERMLFALGPPKGKK